MYHFIIVLVFGSAIVTAQPPSGYKHACDRAAYDGFKCCKKEIFKLPGEEYKECFKLDNKPLIECKVTKCIGKKRGHLNDDGTINSAKIMKDIENNYKNDPDLIDSMKQKCIDRNLNKFGVGALCDLLMVEKCLDYEIIKSCNTWDNEGECAGMKKTAALCIKQYA